MSFYDKQARNPGINFEWQLKRFREPYAASIMEDTHKKSIFFSGRTTKGVGRVNPPDH